MAKSNAKVWGGVGGLIAAVVAAVFAIEGGYVNDPNDSGGETNHGVTIAVARKHGYAGPMEALPRELAQDIYIKDYITGPRFDRVLAVSPAVGTKLVDIGVNAGPGRAAGWFQQSLNDLSRAGRDYGQIATDGVVGPRTLAAYQALEQRRGRAKACELTLKLLDGYQTAHYTKLARGRANASFLVGWLDHRVGNVPAERCLETVEVQ